MRRKQDLVTISQDLSFGRGRGVHKVHQDASSTRGRAIEMPPKSHQPPSSTKGTHPQHNRHQHPHSGKSEELHQNARKRNDRDQMRSGEKKRLTVNQTSEKQTVSDQSKNSWSHNGGSLCHVHTTVPCCTSIHTYVCTPVLCFEFVYSYICTALHIHLYIHM